MVRPLVIVLGLTAVLLPRVHGEALASDFATSLLAETSVATLRLDAPFDDLFTGAQDDEDYAVDGRLTMTGDGADATVPVKISLRGHTSRRETECSFPKLKLKAADGVAIKIGTHCGESTDDTLTQKFGRLPNEKSPWREAAVYQLLDALAVPVLRARPARITYAYPDGHAVVRNAMLLEDDEAGRKRLGEGREIEADAFTSADRLFAPADAARLAFAEALIGNFDWCVKFTAGDTYRCDAKMKLWNVMALPTGADKALPVMYDFDVSGMVTGSHRWFGDIFNAAFVPSKSPREIEVISQLQRTRTLFPRALLDTTRRYFLDRKASANRAIAEAAIDDAGRGIIREYFDTFYREIASEDLFYRPVVTSPGTMARAGADPSASAVCENRGAIPVGTPVGKPIETRGDVMRVVVLDALWHWTSPSDCDAILKGAVWIPTDAVTRDFPTR